MVHIVVIMAHMQLLMIRIILAALLNANIMYLWRAIMMENCIICLPHTALLA